MNSGELLIVREVVEVTVMFLKKHLTVRISFSMLRKNQNKKTARLESVFLDNVLLNFKDAKDLPTFLAISSRCHMTFAFVRTNRE